MQRSESHPDSPMLLIAGVILGALTWPSSQLVGILARPIRRAGIERASWWAVELYVLASFVVSIPIWILAPEASALGYALVALLLARLLDMVATQLRIVLVDSARTQWGLLSVQRSLLLGLLNLLQVIVIFAAADRVLAAHSFCADNCSEMPASALGFLYVSWTTITLGSGFRPVDAVAKSLVMAEVTCAVIILVISVAWLVSGIRIRQVD